MDKLKILVVDDESRMRKLVKDFLVKKDFEVFEAGDGAEAIDLFFSEKDIALIILDVMMPKMDGWEVCREIRQHSKVPIIMLTARADERDELLGFELGVDEYISKPFSPKILVARVEAILRRTNAIGAEEVLTAGEVTINNVDITIIAQAPKLAAYNDQMRTNISETLGIPVSAVNIKATTEEGLGFTGRGEGIAAIATCAIEGRFI